MAKSARVGWHPRCTEHRLVKKARKVQLGLAGSVVAALVVAYLLGSAPPAPLFASVRPGAIVPARSAPSVTECGATHDDAGDGSDPPTAVVMRAILQCGDELGLSEAQTARLEEVADTFVRETIGRQQRLSMMQLDLLALLRPDPVDPAKPADLAAAERKIREIGRVTVEQDVAFVRAVEAVKAVLTSVQRATLATLLIAPPPPTL
jgi:hypothetical protein